MTAHRFFSTPQLATSAKEAKARRQELLQRIRRQRAQTYKRTVPQLMQDGV